MHFDLIEELPLAVQKAASTLEDGEDAPRARAEGDTLLIPHGVRVQYALEMPAAARVVFEGVRPQNGQRGTLDVSVTPHDAETRILARLSGEQGRTELEWRAEAPQIVRLSLRAERHGMLIRQPAVWVDSPDEASEGSAALDLGQIRGLRGADRPNVVVYLVDSLRADHLGCYGYPKAVSPAVDAFAESALVFDNATANSSWTKSAVASIFTGLWPGSHQAITREDKLPADAVTLAEVLHDAGYVTVGLSTNPSITEEFGFDQGFDRLMQMSRGDQAREANAGKVTESVAEWLREFEGERPFFLYVHTIDPHDPYLPPEEEHARWSPGISTEFAARTGKLVSHYNRTGRSRADAGETVGALEALYDGEIAANDRAFGELLEVLDGAGHLDDAVVIFVADHGEDFGEHGLWRHGLGLTLQSLRIPLIVRLPGEHRTGHEPSLVQQVDILPTLLELLELEGPPRVEGESLLPLFVGHGRAAADGPAYLYVSFRPPDRLGVIWRDWKFVSAAQAEASVPGRLYHLATDLEERRDLAGRFPVMRDFLAAMLARKLLDRDAGLTREQTEISAETRRALRALGYIQ